MTSLETIVFRIGWVLFLMLVVTCVIFIIIPSACQGFSSAVRREFKHLFMLKKYNHINKYNIFKTSIKHLASEHVVCRRNKAIKIVLKGKTGMLGWCCRMVPQLN